MRRAAHGGWWIGALLLAACKVEPIEELVIEDEPAPVVMPGVVLPLERPLPEDPSAAEAAGDAELAAAKELEGTGTVQGLVSTIGRVLALPVRLPWRTAMRMKLPGRWGEPEEQVPAARRADG